MAGTHPVTIGIDLGGTSLRVGLFDDSMAMLDSHSMPTRAAAGPQAAVDEMAAAVRLILKRTNTNGSIYEPRGVGIGSPGPINLCSGVLGLLPNLPGWDNFPLRAALRDATGLPVILESDANAAAIAEWKLGVGKTTGVSSMVMLTLGTGVGSGIIINGKIWHGMFGMGGEVGHATVEPSGLLCGCGSRGCLEMYASANGLLRLAREAADGQSSTSALRDLVATPEGFTAMQVAHLAQAGDLAAKVAFERLGSYLGIGIANLINTLDVPLIVVGGGLASAWKLFNESMFQTIHDYSVVYRLVAPTQRLTMEKDCTYICPAVLGPAAGLLGAALLPHLESPPQAFEAVATSQRRLPDENPPAR
ncbi:MAG TPA: ROK family protein, partial [Acidobacteriaceae bacterium]